MASKTKAEFTANPKKYVRPLFEVESLQLIPHEQSMQTLTFIYVIVR